MWVFFKKYRWKYGICWAKRRFRVCRPLLITVQWIFFEFFKFHANEIVLNFHPSASLDMLDVTGKNSFQRYGKCFHLFADNLLSQQVFVSLANKGQNQRKFRNNAASFTQPLHIRALQHFTDSVSQLTDHQPRIICGISTDIANIRLCPSRSQATRL